MEKSDANDNGDRGTAFTSIVMYMKIGNIYYLYHHLTKW